ncbi:replication-relaxation family protein [Paenibacillus alkaliterrae]|uniref:replication-relaxation family protein n=1 Tax=Paenibacillus alkaliterrae TaxID=320909 RepID=UPI001F4464CC|nr:replication-relaxation family protein [Paenibacillus alkaliterrae]MCF2938889.1 replication-relaxation family protein [Paenibacillus alkaliterrae]
MPITNQNLIQESSSQPLTKQQLKLKRWENVLWYLNRLDYLATSQIESLKLTGGKRNTLRILSDMEESKLISSFVMDEKVFYLAAAGRKLIGSEKIRKRTPNVPHFLMRNDVYLYYRPVAWHAEQPFQWHNETIIPDAYFIKNNQHFFLEVDRCQSMTKNEDKIKSYRSLKDSGLFQKNYGAFPTILFVTTSEHRQKRLRALLDGLKAEVLMLDAVK